MPYTFYAPGAGGNMEGPFATSRKNPLTGRYDTPFTLDDVRLNKSPWVTVASDPSNYGRTINLGNITYRSPLDQQSYTLNNVQGYIHDTGSAFQGRPDKYDIAQGDFRGWDPAVASKFVAGGNSASGGDKMPGGLLDMLTGNNAQPDPGMPTGVAGMSNSLIGLGMGLLQPTNPYRGVNAWTNALQGYQAGAQADAQRAQDAWKRNLAEREFARAGETDFQKMQRDIARYAGTPQAEEVKRFYAAKMGETPQLVSVEDPNSPGEKMSVLFNPRAPAGQQFTDLTGKPLNIGGATAAATPGTSAPDSSIWTTGGGGVGYGQAGVGAGVFGPGAATTAPPTPAPQDQQYRTSPKTFEPEQKLRKEFEDVAKPYILAAQSYKKMTASQPTAAGDIALIFGYMKMLDPPSTVREGEFATAQNSGGVEDRIRNIYNKLLSGERLQPGQREDFMKQGAAVWDRYRQEYTPRVAQFSQIAKQYRIDPRRIIPDIGELPIGSEEHPATTQQPATAQQPAQRIPRYNPSTGQFE